MRTNRLLEIIYILLDNRLQTAEEYASNKTKLTASEESDLINLYSELKMTKK